MNVYEGWNIIMNNVCWTEVKVVADKKAEEVVTAILMDYAPDGLSVEDYSDIDACEWDYTDEALLTKDKENIIFRIYLPRGSNVLASTSEIKKRLETASKEMNLGDFNIGFYQVNESEWVDCWKKYFKPISVGDRLVVKPSWESYDAREDEIVVEIDPGCAFGTGIHATTKLCMQLLEKHVKSGDTLLDIGSGSGILSITAAKLGASAIDAVDIDPNAVKITNANAQINGVFEKINAFKGNLFKMVQGEYDIVATNVKADIVMEMIPEVDKHLKENAKFIISGVIDYRVADVERLLGKYDYKIIEKISDDGWAAFCVEK